MVEEEVPLQKEDPGKNYVIVKDEDPGINWDEYWNKDDAEEHAHSAPISCRLIENHLDLIFEMHKDLVEKLHKKTHPQEALGCPIQLTVKRCCESLISNLLPGI
jgi:hypothetical protein